MPYTAFHEKFPGIAEKENRKATSIKSDKRVKIGRNDPCPCGSGKKYKNCCMKKKVLPKKNYT